MSSHFALHIYHCGTASLVPVSCPSIFYYYYFRQGEVNSRCVLSRLHRYGMGIHLLQRGSDSSPNALAAARPPAINPKGNHISFQVTTRALSQN